MSGALGASRLVIYCGLFFTKSGDFGGRVRKYEKKNGKKSLK
jgi:hypothetical protein